MAESFLGRWSERKRAVAAGQSVPEPAFKAAPEPVPASPSVHPLVDPLQPVATTAPPEPAPAPPTLEDAQALTPQSDFKPFVASHVSPEVKNAAMKKLFADPHFNVMDRLDIYIDDYSQPDPLPESMLRQMASAHFLGLFDDPPQAQTEEQNVPVGVSQSDQAALETVATEADRRPTPDQALPDPSTPPDPDHADPDLRLQPNHATGPQEPGGGTQ
ncbi:DUF3306 domain-containing protein [Rhodoferax sp.]|uniref:DUF3306 domain-containing protein n=1 Tax=Rhodoferax sp. TaxID=50421 RepID=UPI002768EAD7|nr:DUF3306 domain-containing protein [Rhodoferax sp.]